MNFYDDEINNIFKALMGADDHFELVERSDRFFEKLSFKFPMTGSKISWRNVPGAVSGGALDSSGGAELSDFFSRICNEYMLSGQGVYIGDGLTNIAVIASLNVIQKALPSIALIPQHHYIIDPDAEWCISFTMEGDLDFGLSP